MAAGHPDLAVLGDPERRARERRPDRADLDRVGPVDGGGRRGLGQAVALEHAQAEPAVEVAEPFAERCAAGDGVHHVAAERRAQLAVDQPVGDGVLGLEHGVCARRRLVGTRVGDRDLGGPAEQAQLDARAGLLLGRVVDLLEDPRHGEQEGRAERLQVRQQVLGVGGVAEHCAGRDAQHLDEPREHVRERHEEQRARIGLRAHLTEPVRPVEGQADEVAVGELDALGSSRRPGRVDDRREVIHPGQSAATLDLGVGHPGAGRHERGDGLGVDDEHPPELRKFAACLGHDRGVRGGLDDREADVGVGQDPADLFHRGRLVDRDAHGAGGPDREVEDRPLVPRVRHERDPLAGRDSEGHEPLGDRGDLRGEGACGHGDPGAAQPRLALREGALGCPGDALRQHRADARRGRDVDQGGGRELEHVRGSRGKGTGVTLTGAAASSRFEVAPGVALGLPLARGWRGQPRPRAQ